jgi:hypothetical protein
MPRRAGGAPGGIPTPPVMPNFASIMAGGRAYASWPTGGGPKLTMPSGDPISWYDAHADRLARDYEAVPADQLHRWLAELVPADGGVLVFDVGAGTARDAAWLASKGH